MLDQLRFIEDARVGTDEEQPGGRAVLAWLFQFYSSSLVTFTILLVLSAIRAFWLELGAAVPVDVPVRLGDVLPHRLRGEVGRGGVAQTNRRVISFFPFDQL